MCISNSVKGRENGNTWNNQQERSNCMEAQTEEDIRKRKKKEKKQGQRGEKQDTINRCQKFDGEGTTTTHVVIRPSRETKNLYAFADYLLEILMTKKLNKKWISIFLLIYIFMLTFLSCTLFILLQWIARVFEEGYVLESETKSQKNTLYLSRIEALEDEKILMKKNYAATIEEKNRELTEFKELKREYILESEAKSQENTLYLSRIEALEDEKILMKKNYAATIEEKNRELTELKELKREYILEIEECHQSFHHVSHIKHSLQNERDQLSRVCRGDEEMHTLLLNERELLEAKVGELEKKTSRLQAKIGESEGKNLALVKQCENSKKMIHKLERRNDELRKEYEASRNKCELFVSEMEKQSKKLKKSLKKAVNELTALQLPKRFQRLINKALDGLTFQY